MNAYVGVTDNRWFHFLSERQPDEVNFWRPGGAESFGTLKEGEPFLFKLHSPLNYIVGLGFFVKYTRLPVSMAWRLFTEKNGCPDHSAFLNTIANYRREQLHPGFDPTIGCIILAIPFFFNREEWIPTPADFHPNIVQGKTYDISSGSGADLWKAVLERIGKRFDTDALREPHHEERRMRLVEERIGQGAFRARVLDAYGRRCAITGERTMPVLEAAHIRPYANKGPNSLSNGLLLKADLHILFDEGYVTVTPDYRVEISRRIKEDFENGRDYYALQGKALTALPANALQRPSKDFIEWHNQQIYNG